MENLPSSILTQSNVVAKPLFDSDALFFRAWMTNIFAIIEHDTSSIIVNESIFPVSS
jgi:hypothetical protein